jgi:hypothetical protein
LCDISPADFAGFLQHEAKLKNLRNRTKTAAKTAWSRPKQDTIRTAFVRGIPEHWTDEDLLSPRQASGDDVRSTICKTETNGLTIATGILVFRTPTILDRWIQDTGDIWSSSLGCYLHPPFDGKPQLQLDMFISTEERAAWNWLRYHKAGKVPMLKYTDSNSPIAVDETEVAGEDNEIEKDVNASKAEILNSRQRVMEASSRHHE